MLDVKRINITIVISTLSRLRRPTQRNDLKCTDAPRTANRQVNRLREDDGYRALNMRTRAL